MWVFFFFFFLSLACAYTILKRTVRLQCARHNTCGWTSASIEPLRWGPTGTHTHTHAQLHEQSSCMRHAAERMFFFFCCINIVHLATAVFRQIVAKLYGIFHCDDGQAVTAAAAVAINSRIYTLTRDFEQVENRITNMVSRVCSRHEWMLNTVQWVKCVFRRS